MGFFVIVTCCLCNWQSCEINLTIGKYAPQYPNGYITAQGRNSSDDPSGFVFKSCVFTGTGKTYLGRAYGAYSRVIIYKSVMTDIIVASGWDAWTYVHHEYAIKLSHFIHIYVYIYIGDQSRFLLRGPTLLGEIFEILFVG